MFALGDVNAAMEEYGRLAALGSGRARCITAYAYLVGSSLTPRDADAARRIALSAASSEPGYSNYILGFIALEEGNHASSFAHFIASRKVGFLPAFSASAQLHSNLYGAAERDRKLSEKLFIRAVENGQRRRSAEDRAPRWVVSPNRVDGAATVGRNGDQDVHLGLYIDGKSSKALIHLSRQCGL